MKHTAYFGLFMLLSTFTCFGQQKSKPVEKILIAGSYWDSIAILDKKTKKMVWSYPLPEKSECNSISLTKEGNILFSYKRGARLIDRQGNLVFDYTNVTGNEELQSAYQYTDGTYYGGICGNPMRIVELNTDGNLIREIKYNLNIQEPHAQFRQIYKTKAGTYLIPLITQGKVIELSITGELLFTYNTGGNPFAVRESSNGNLWIGCGDAHCALEVDRKSGNTLSKINIKDLTGIELQFIAQVSPVAQGLMIANWNGHSNKKEPHLIEVDKSKKVIWRFDDHKNVKYISAFFPFSE